MIVDAVMPLLLEFGPAVTSRQIAEAAGISEGTVYKAFGDKASLIQAAVDKQMDPAPLLRELGGIDPALPLEDKVLRALGLLQERFREAFRFMAMFDKYQKPSSGKSQEGFARVFREFLEPDLGRLNCDPDRVWQILRLLAFSSSLPRLNGGETYGAEELTGIILYGIAGAKPPHRNRELGKSCCCEFSAAT